MSNPRYTAFVEAHGEGLANWEYTHFIALMKRLYVGCIYSPIFNHDEFTTFISNNAQLYIPEGQQR